MTTHRQPSLAAALAGRLLCGVAFGVIAGLVGDQTGGGGAIADPVEDRDRRVDQLALGVSAALGLGASLRRRTPGPALARRAGGGYERCLISHRAGLPPRRLR